MLWRAIYLHCDGFDEWCSAREFERCSNTHYMIVGQLNVRRDRREAVFLFAQINCECRLWPLVDIDLCSAECPLSGVKRT
jgi:hypothetical protein